ncbi:hypothetical protein LTR17_017604 [Elasticomyces elasticus]|nr:hypothetical protein LTR17_017604 [Elasticomyces elasticus]
MLPTRNERARKAVSQTEASYETSLESRVHASVFTKLDVAKREIRLLTLRPARSRSEPLSMELAVVSLDNSPAFAAISYCWGHEKITISVQGFDFEIPLTLYVALLHIRGDKAALVIWADVICINQKDEEERTSQVSLMGETYRLAEEVLIWLGSHQEELSGLAFQTLGVTARSRSLEEGLKDSELDSLKWLFSRLLSDRSWIVQEPAMSGGRVVYMCGSERLLSSTPLQELFKAINTSGLLSNLDLNVAERQSLEESIVKYADFIDTPASRVFRLLDVYRTQRSPILSLTNVSHIEQAMTIDTETQPVTDEGYYSKDRTDSFSGSKDGRQPVAEDDMLSIVTDNWNAGLQTAWLGRNDLAGTFAREILDNLSVPGIRDDAIDALPELLKAYASTLHSRASGDQERTACAFVRRQRKDITKRARELLGSEKRRSDENVDKMDIAAWATDVSGDADEAADEPEEEADVAELPGTDDLPADLKRARLFLLESREFTWLIRRVISASETMTTGLESCALRSQLFCTEPLLPEMVHVSLDWDPIQFVRDQYPEAHETSLGSSITYIGSDDLVEAIGCEEYIERTWPFHGNLVLSCVERAMETEGKEATVHASKESGFTVIQIVISAGTTRATIRGDLIGVSEAVEALAWLGAACRAAPGSCKVMYCSPCLMRLEQAGTFRVSYEVSRMSVEPMQETFNNRATLEAMIRPQASGFLSGGTAAASAHCWRTLVRNPVVARGYPIARRHQDEEGLEMSLNVMATLAQAYRATVFDGVLVLKGFCTMLVAAARVGQSVLWHYLSGPNGRPVCYSTVSKVCAHPGSIGMEGLDSQRHFLGWAQCATTQIGTQEGNYDVDFTRGDFAKPGCVLKDVTVGFSKYIGVSAKVAPGKKDSRLEGTKNCVYESQIDDAETLRVLFYDTPTKRGWLFHGSDALLHMSRAYLSSPHAPPYRHNFSKRLVEAFTHRDPSVSTRTKARSILRDKQNRDMLVSLENDADSDPEFSASTTVSESENRLRFEDIVVRFYETMREMVGHQVKLQEAEQWNIPISKSPFAVRLEGFGFADLMSAQPRMKPRYAGLTRSGPTWMQMTTTNGAINIFGSGFGDLFSTASSCKRCTEIPSGYNFLVSSGELLKDMARYWGGLQPDHLEVAESVFWNRPDLSFGSPAVCHCPPLSHGIRCGTQATQLDACGALPLQGWERPRQDVFRMHPQSAVIIGRTKDMTRAQTEAQRPDAHNSCSSCERHTTTITARSLSSTVEHTASVSSASSTSTIPDLLGSDNSGGYSTPITTTAVESSADHRPLSAVVKEETLSTQSHSSSGSEGLAIEPRSLTRRSAQIDGLEPASLAHDNLVRSFGASPRSRPRMPQSNAVLLQKDGTAESSPAGSEHDKRDDYAGAVPQATERTPQRGLRRVKRFTTPSSICDSEDRESTRTENCSSMQPFEVRTFGASASNYDPVLES